MAGVGGTSAGGDELRPHELMAYYNDLEIAKQHRGALCDALILPDHDLDRTTYPGHAPDGPFGGFGPREVTRGSRNGDVLGARYSVLNIRNAAKNLDECQKYIALGCDVNEVFTASRGGDTMGWAALHFAAKWDRLDVIQCLLDNGADPLLRTWDEETAQVIARKRGNYAAVRMLESFVKTGSTGWFEATPPLPAPKEKSDPEEFADLEDRIEYLKESQERKNCPKRAGLIKELQRVRDEALAHDPKLADATKLVQPKSINYVAPQKDPTFDDEDLHYNDYDYLKDPVVEKPAPDLNDDADLEMIPKRIKQPKAWEVDSDVSDLEEDDFQ